ncbi:MAG: VWA domain-containing protein [Verrucomicrobia bacterium]|nr:VWA domain-containing protein [Verrucomicrobiota bacterium]MDA0723580.1 VWA domain-containing protein [Verrucomicrobiota bacterium]MDA1046194.1 VWA domain-containing protein [Verrucomicrobiota bacterium]
MKKYSLFLLSVVLAFAGGLPGFAKKKKTPVLPEVKLKVELDRKVLPAGKTERVVLKISLEPDQVVRDEANRAPVNLALVLDRSGSMSGEKIEQAKEAAIQAIRRLGATDRISIVAYSNHAETIVPAQSAKNTEKLVDLVRQLQASGKTALFAGVNQGAAELRKNLEGEYFNRIILLSDGLANHGPSSTEDLVRLGRALVKEDISVSTVGLGTGYNEDLMAGLAKEGQGNLYFAETSKELPGIFDAEIGDALNVVARHATLRIELEDGVRPIRLIGRQGAILENHVEIEINQLYGGQEKFALLEVEVTAGKAKEKKNLARIVAKFKAAENGLVISRKTTVSCAFSEREKEVTASINEKVVVAYVDNEVAQAKDAAIALADEGRHEDAVKKLKKLCSTIDSRNVTWGSSSVNAKNRQFLSELEELKNDNGLTNKKRKAWRSSNYQIQSQQKAIPYLSK